MIRKLAYSSLFLLLGACGAADDGSVSEGAQNETDSVVVSSVTDGTYVIKSVATGKCLDVNHSGTENGAKVQEWTCNNSNAQKFNVVGVGGGSYKILNVNSNKGLDIEGVSYAENARVHQWEYVGGQNQQFYFVNRGGNDISIHPRHTNMALDVFWGRSDDGTEIVQYPWTGNSNQRWIFEKEGGGGDGGGALPTRLRIKSNCGEPIWIAHSDNVPDGQNIRLDRGQYHDYNIPDSGLAATRFWPKIGCDSSGNNCKIGQSSAPCPSGGCQPPVDSKFEATFGAKGGSQNTWYNASQVDGYTLPFRIDPRGGSAGQGDCVGSDAGALSLDRCPTDEDMSGGGRFPAGAHADLRIRDSSGRTIGCLSPCKKWNYPAPWGYGRPEHEDPGIHLCCPTPIDPATGQCTVANSCMTSQSCSNASDPLSVVHTDYVKVMNEMAPTTYSYAYDDARGLHQCSPDTTYEVTFCP